MTEVPIPTVNVSWGLPVTLNIFFLGTTDLTLEAVTPFLCRIESWHVSQNGWWRNYEKKYLGQPLSLGKAWPLTLTCGHESVLCPCTEFVLPPLCEKKFEVRPGGLERGFSFYFGGGEDKTVVECLVLPAPGSRLTSSSQFPEKLCIVNSEVRKQIPLYLPCLLNKGL